jgi:hypothetical protein
MVPGGLEEKVFKLKGFRGLNPLLSFSPQTLLDMLQMLVGGIWPVIGGMLIFAFCLQGTMARDSMIDGVVTTDAVILMTLYIIGVPVLSTLSHRNIMRVQVRIRQALGSSDIVLRVLTDWRPDYRDSELVSMLRRIDPTESGQHDLAAVFHQVGRQLSFCLGLRDRPRLPFNGLLPLLLVPFAVGQVYMLHQLYGPYPGYELTMVLMYFQFAGSMLAVIVVNLLAAAAFEQHFELYLLREHLREIDNGVPAVDVPGAVDTH